MKSDRENKDKKIPGYRVDTEQYEHKSDLAKQGHVHDVSVHTKKQKQGKKYAPAAIARRDYYTKLERALLTAQREYTGQEIIRLFNPANPKTRLGIKFADDNTYEASLVYSQQVQGFRTLEQVIAAESLPVVLQKIHDGLAGKQGGYTGLGRIMVLALLTTESDLHLANIGIDDQGRFVKIDGDWTFGRLRYKEMERQSGLMHKFIITKEVLNDLPLLNADHAFPYNWFDQFKRGCDQGEYPFLEGIQQKPLRDEMFQTILNILVMPDRYFEMICQRSVNEPLDAPTNHLELMNARLQLMHSALQTPDFVTYLQSDKAKAGLQQFAETVADFRMAGKEPLGDKTSIEASMLSRFEQCHAVASAPAKSPVWNDRFLNLIDADVNRLNMHGESTIMLTALQGDENLYSLLVQKGAKENAIANDNTTCLSMAALGGHEKLFNKLLLEQKKLKGPKCLGAALLAATQQGNMNIVNTLLAAGADINTRDKCNNTPLIHAAKLGHYEVVRLLLQHNAEPMCQNKWGLNPLSYAALCGNEDIVTYLLKNTQLNTVASNALIAASHGHSDSIMRQLINAGADVHHANTLGQTPIHILAISGKIELMKSLLQQGATLDTRDKESRTPLMNAVLTNNLKMVDFILSSPTGRNTLNYADDAGDSAITLAIAKGQWKIVVRLLQEKGINLAQENNKKQTPLSLAYDKNKFQLIDDLLNFFKVNPNTPLCGKRKESLLFVYVRQENTAHIDKFIQLGGDLEFKNTRGETAIFAAIEAQRNNAAIHLLTISAAAEDLKQADNLGRSPLASTPNKEGVTPLAYAALCNNADIIPHLIAAGANVNQPIPPNFTALTVAILNKHSHCAEKLLTYGATLNSLEEVPKNLLDKTIDDLLKKDRGDLVFKLLSSCNALDYDLSFSDKGHNLLQIAVANGDPDLVSDLIKHGVKITSDVIELAKKGYHYYRDDAKQFEPETPNIEGKRDDFQAVVKALQDAQHQPLIKKSAAVSTGDITASLSSAPKSVTPPHTVTPLPSSKGTAYFDKPVATPKHDPNSPAIVINERPADSGKKNKL